MQNTLSLKKYIPLFVIVILALAQNAFARTKKNTEPKQPAPLEVVISNIQNTEKLTLKKFNFDLYITNGHANKVYKYVITLDGTTNTYEFNNQTHYPISYDVDCKIDSSYTNTIFIDSNKLLQQKIQKTVPNKIERYIEQDAEFVGGSTVLENYIAQQLKVSAKRKKGEIQCEFVIEKDGTVSNIKVVKGLCPKCDQDAIDVLAKMPKWRPGKTIHFPDGPKNPVTNLLRTNQRVTIKYNLK